MRYTAAPKEISSIEVRNKGYSFSSAQYTDVIIPNKNFFYFRDLLSRKLKRSDLGIEIGSINYTDQSGKFFIRTKGLQSYSYLPDINNESVIPMNPKVFIDQKLLEGDLIISKDGNIGEIIILDKDYPNWMLSSALYKLPIKKWKYYLLAVAKHDCFREQIDYMVPKGATIRHAKQMFLDCKIPLPSKDQENVIYYIELLVQAAINTEKEIHNKHNIIFESIRNELVTNQKTTNFEYSYPTIKELQETRRIDTNLYTQYFKSQEFIIKNYSKGFSAIKRLGFEISRGQNLQISTIGKSIYSNMNYPSFYMLVLPKYLSKFGTINEVEYLGNRKLLKTLKKGDLIFGAEGFEKGRSIVVLNDYKKTITNIHGITLHQKQGDLILSVFVKCFLDYLRTIGLIDLYAVGGNGGSLAMKYWDVIPFPNFPDPQKKKISKLFYNPDAELNVKSLTIENFIEEDTLYNSNAGINELNQGLQKIKNRIDFVIDQIVNDIPVECNFEMLN